MSQSSLAAPTTNPYVGPRAFWEAEGRLFFGREREARDLVARVVSERLLLFYAQSGAGKSSLINARLIPRLRDQEGFQVLPVGRVSGELPGGVDAVDSIFVFNLMASLDQSGEHPARLAQLTLSQFLARLAGESVPGASGERTRHWVYKPQAAIAGPAGGGQPAPFKTGPRFALVVDQFEEIITSYPMRWQERDEFFRQLNQAMLDDPNLWVVLALREDYVAALDPYAPLLADRLRARFYMERMDVAAALEAIRRPAELGGRPFAPGVAERLVDDLRQVRVAGQAGAVAGQYVEPVQLQVVCYQLWERVAGGEGRTARGEERGAGSDGRVGQPAITADDLAAAGDVNQALEQYYVDALAEVLAEPAVQAAGVSERALRSWFDQELITETGVRSTVFRNESDGRTGSLPNVAVDALGRRYLLRTELRGGGAWVELVHDRFVEPIRGSNALWFPQHLSALQRQAALWDDEGRQTGLLLSSEALAEAEAWAGAHAGELEAHERDFLQACLQARVAAERELEHARAVRNRSLIALGATAAALVLAVVAGWLLYQQNQSLEGERLLQEARQSKQALDAQDAIAKFQAAVAADPTLQIDLSAEISDTLRYVATQFVQEGEKILCEARSAQPTRCVPPATGQADGQVPINIPIAQTHLAWADAVAPQLVGWPANASPLQQQAVISATALFSQALALNPPSDTPVYVWIEPGEFLMGSSDADNLAQPDEKPQHAVWLDGYWIQRTEVTNEQYKRCVDAAVCTPLFNPFWDKPRSARLPVTYVDWQQASTYAQWVGGRLPTEAEWERACRGAGGAIYPWGDEPPSPERLNYSSDVGRTADVGDYPAGANGLYDMAGNVWEWTADWYGEDYYADSYADSPKRNPTGPETSNYGTRTSRGGSFAYDDLYVRCALRGGLVPDDRGPYIGFRIVLSPFSPLDSDRFGL